MARIMWFVALCCGVVGASPPAWAQGSLDRCNDILQQDLFNKVTKSTQSSSREKAAYAEYIFGLDENKAYDEYRKAYKSSKKQGESGSLEGGYGWGFIDGDIDFSHSYERQLEQDDFSKKFNEAKAVHQKNSSSSSSREASLISMYQSSVRDTASVKAWEHCMMTKYPEPGLFAWGYRDPGGNPYIVVMWAPGTFAAANPVISVKFNVTEPGMTVEGAAGAVQIATGTGAAFPVSFSNANDSKRQSEGFAVLVNGELSSGDRLVQSFRSEAVVPRYLGPSPCSLVFTANRSYEIGVRDSTTGNMVWYAGMVTMQQRAAGRGGRGRGAPAPVDESPNPQGELAYAGRLSLQGQTETGVIRVGVAGTNVVVTDDTGNVFLSGGCTGEGVRGVITSAVQPLDVMIRPR